MNTCIKDDLCYIYIHRTEEYFFSELSGLVAAGIVTAMAQVQV
jgi:hypothetical protein